MENKYDERIFEEYTSIKKYANNLKKNQKIKQIILKDRINYLFFNTIN